MTLEIMKTYFGKHVLTVVESRHSKMFSNDFLIKELEQNLSSGLEETSEYNQSRKIMWKTFNRYTRLNKCYVQMCK